MRPDKNDSEIRDSPLYWFSVLERARETGDFRRALQAKRELERLGILVAYHRPARQEDQRAD
jgi:hypothetical protein